MMGIQNFPIPFPIGLGMGGVSAEAFVLFLNARLPCGAGLEVPLFHEPAIASTILCNVAINGILVNLFLTFQHNDAFSATPGPT